MNGNSDIRSNGNCVRPRSETAWFSGVDKGAGARGAQPPILQTRRLNYTKFGQLILRKITEILKTKSYILKT